MEKTATQVLQQQVRVWRDRRSLSAQALADRISKIGGSLSRAAISKIENGDRGVSVDEWLLLAHALAVPPPLLLLDLESGRRVQLTDSVELHPWIVWGWLRGEIESPVSTPEGTALVSRVEEFNSARVVIDLYKAEEEAASAVQDARSAIRTAKYVGDEAALQKARSNEVDALRTLAHVFDSMVEHGVTPPGKVKEWIDKIRDLELSRYPDALEIFDGDSGQRVPFKPPSTWSQ